MNRSMFKFVIFLIIIFGGLYACNGKRLISKYQFEKYCNEENRVGFFLYEKIKLEKEFFRDIPTDEKELRRLDKGYYINDRTLLIDKERFKQSYIISYWKKTTLSSIGPIYAFESTIVRKSDGKVISKGVSLLNMLDKSSKYFVVEGVWCPTGKSYRGSYIAGLNHSKIVQKTFSY